MNVLVIGSCSWDKIMKVDNIDQLYDDMFFFAKDYYESVGSTGAGKALALKALGADVTLVTSFADDEYGNRVKEYLERYDIKYINLMVDKTISHTNIMHGKGKRISITTDFPKIKPTIFGGMEKLVKNADLVYLNINDFARPYINLIKKHKKTCFVDIHDYTIGNPHHTEFIEASDILVGSSVYIEDQQGFIVEQVNNGRTLAVLTSGDKGLLAYNKDQKLIHVDGYNEMDFIDSNGAGDSFCAGLGVALLNNFDIKDALQLGSIVGGVACSSKELYNFNVKYKDILEILKKRA